MLLADEEDKLIGQDRPLNRRHGLEATIWQAKAYHYKYEDDKVF
jgi:hypothetical protein